MALCLSEFPAELLGRVAAFLQGDKASLGQFRLTCKRFGAVGENFLFHELSATTDLRDTRYVWVALHPKLSAHVKHLNFHIPVDLQAFPYPSPYLLWKKHTSSFPNTRSMTLFLPELSKVPWNLQQIEERVKDTCTILDTIEKSRVQELRIKNFPIVRDSAWTAQALTLGALRSLLHFEVSLIMEKFNRAPAPAIDPDVQFFLGRLQRSWLRPASNLTRLSLHMNMYYGYVPKLDFRGLHFPHLQSLELGKLVFSHDWQINWIISHATTLTDLAIDDCPILYEAMTPPEWPFDSENYPVIAAFFGIQFTEPPTWWQNCIRWDEVFSRFRKELHQLRSFSFGASREPMEPVRLLEQTNFYVTFKASLWEEQIQPSRQAFSKNDASALWRLLNRHRQVVSRRKISELRDSAIDKLDAYWEAKFGSLYGPIDRL